MSAALLRLIHRFDRIRLARFRRRWRHGLEAAPDVTANLRFMDLRIESGGRLQIAAGFYTERQRGNRIWVQAGARVDLGERAWLRTEYGVNHVTAFPGARIHVGRDALLNGAMLHAKSSITIGCESRLAFGSRILDADLHDLDSETPERVEPITIGDRVWIGANAMVLRGVTIGDDVVIAAGSIVTHDIPSRKLALGTPARPVRDLAPRTSCH